MALQGDFRPPLGAPRVAPPDPPDLAPGLLAVGLHVDHARHSPPPVRLLDRARRGRGARDEGDRGESGAEDITGDAGGAFHTVGVGWTWPRIGRARWELGRTSDGDEPPPRRRLVAFLSSRGPVATPLPQSIAAIASQARRARRARVAPWLRCRRPGSPGHSAPPISNKRPP